MAITHLKNEKNIIILCDSCFAKITHHTRIQCNDCKVDMCIPCYYDVETPRQHAFDHSYRIIEPLDFNLFDKTWSALEELLLIEALYSLGISNWQDIADFIGTKTANEIENHFYTIFNLKNNTKYETKDKNPLYSNPNIHEIVSYMPLRKDFEHEYENDIEYYIKELNNDPLFETPEIKELRSELFNAYQTVMEIRSHRKFIMLEKNMIDFKELQNKEVSLNENELKILNSIKPIASYISKADFNSFFQGLCIENELKNKLESGVKSCSGNSMEYEMKRAELLSKKERDLCNYLRLSFKDYLKIKEIIISEKFKSEYLDIKKIKVLVGCFNEKIDYVFDFFKNNEWV